MDKRHGEERSGCEERVIARSGMATAAREVWHDEVMPPVVVIAEGNSDEAISLLRHERDCFAAARNDGLDSALWRGTD